MSVRWSFGMWVVVLVGGWLLLSAGGAKKSNKLVIDVTVSFNAAMEFLLFVCLCVYLSVCFSVGLSVCFSVCLFVCVSVCLCVYLSVCFSVCLFVYLFVCLSVCLTVCLSVCQIFIFHTYELLQAIDTKVRYISIRPTRVSKKLST